MSVELDPPDLGFRRPFTHEVTRVLTIRNPNSDPVAFKVKTTAPKQYCVRPNSGRIEPGKDVEIQVLLQAMKEDPPLDHRCRDKFLVQSVAISPDQDIYNIAAIWQNIEKTAKSSIQERKIRVTFLSADDHGNAPISNNVNGTHVPEEAPPAYGATTPSYGSPAPDAVTPHDRSQNNPPASTAPEAAQDTPPAIGSLLTNPGAAFTAASTGMSNAASATSETLQQQLAAAKAQIAQLKEAAQDENLRQRKIGEVKQSVSDGIQTAQSAIAQQEGVPVQIVAALCLLSFLLAYFLF